MEYVWISTLSILSLQVGDVLLDVLHLFHLYHTRYSELAELGSLYDLIHEKHYHPDREERLQWAKEIAEGICSSLLLFQLNFPC